MVWIVLSINTNTFGWCYINKCTQYSGNYLTLRSRNMRDYLSDLVWAWLAFAIPATPFVVAAIWINR